MEISPYEEEEGWRQAQVSAPKYNDVMSMRFKSQAVFLNRSCVLKTQCFETLCSRTPPDRTRNAES